MTPHHTLARVFEEMGLGSYEARALAAIVNVGSATAGQLAKLSGVTRPNVYPALESLRTKGLVEARHGKVTEWVSPGREEVVHRLVQVQEQRLQNTQDAIKKRAEEALTIVAKMGAGAPAPTQTFLRVMRNEIDMAALYARSLKEATDEVLVFNRGPYPGRIVVAKEVTEAVARGVRARALYQVTEVEDPGFEAFHATVEAYADAGVEARVVDEVLVPMAVFDRKVVLFALDDLMVPEAGFETDVAVDHGRFAAFCVEAFDEAWATARPCEPMGIDLREQA